MFHYVTILITVLLDMLAVWTFSRVLVMRSNRIFFLSSLACILAHQLLMELQSPPALCMLFGMATFGFGLPIMLSEGSVGVRVIRTTLVNLAAVMGEYAGRVLHVLLTGSSFAEGTSDDQIPAVLATYALVGVIAAILMHIIIVVCERTDYHRDYTIDLPVLFLMLWSSALYGYLDLVCHDLVIASIPYALTLFLCCALTLILGIATLSLAHDEARMRRIAANNAASVRQVRHMHAEIESAAQRSLKLRELRHDMANQIEVVLELARKGNSAEADRYLASLQIRAAELKE